jgi:hypothetical protein
MYSAAGRALSRAGTWIIVGYSCPGYDSDMLELLSENASRARRSTPEPEICVVSPDAESIAERVSAQIEPTVQFVNSSFTDFRQAVDACIPKGPM